MRVLILLAAAAVCGCGATVVKKDPGENPPPAGSTAVVPEAPKEVYDKVAPMPREVNAPRK